MLQLLVYAGMQVPVGLLVDRFGSRSVLLSGTLLMTLAQTGFALAESYPLALLARVFVGMGDAMTFICVLRLVSSWFPPRRIPFVTQVTGTLGQAGALVAAIPMTWALGHLGWTRAYLLAASVGVAAGRRRRWWCCATPRARGTCAARACRWPRCGTSLAASWAHPGHPARLLDALLDPVQRDHADACCGATRSSCAARAAAPPPPALLLTVIVVAIMFAGPVLGWLVGAHPWHRSTTVLTIVGSIVTVWTVVLLWPGNAPLRLLVAARVRRRRRRARLDDRLRPRPHLEPRRAAGQRQRHHQPGRLPGQPAAGRGDRPDPGLAHPGRQHDYTPEAFRWAMSAQYVLWGLGLTQVWRYRRRTRAVVSRDELEGVLRRPA